MTKEDKIEIPRRCAASEIKLLRLDLFSHGKSISEDIGCEWTHAQPAENLSPARAAHALGVEIWAPKSVVTKRYKTLQMRYPPEQFMDKHVDWRPAFDLLSNPRRRLNWFWQSGFLPLPESHTLESQNQIWNESSMESPLSPSIVLQRLSEL
jgi:hypothetical protein